MPKPDDLTLAPQALLLNVPSGDPCPCPFESTGSFQVNGSSGMTLTWTSADRNVAEVSAQGIVSAVSAGTTTLTLSAGDLTATASVQVLDKGGRAAVEIR